jgi:hypothetical protein
VNVLKERRKEIYKKQQHLLKGKVVRIVVESFSAIAICATPIDTKVIR